MNNYFPLHLHSYHSLLDGLSCPTDIAARLTKCNMAGSVVSDHGTISSVIEMINAFKTPCKNCGWQSDVHENNKGKCLLKGETCQEYLPHKLKNIFGNEFYLCSQDSKIKDKTNRQLYHCVAFAKNRQGWQNLVRATTASNDPERFYYKPRLTLEELGGFAKNDIIAISGHPGSAMANVLFTDYKSAYRSKTAEEARMALKPDAFEQAVELANKHAELFGKENFYLEIQIFDAKNVPAAGVIGEVLRKVAYTTGIKPIATPDSHYAFKEQAQDQRIILCAAMRTNLQDIKRQMDMDDDVGFSAFFKSNNYHIPSYEEMIGAGQTEEELTNTLRVADMVETYELASKPRFPSYPVEDSKQFLVELCREGWKRKCKNIPKEMHATYGERVKYELEVLNGADLANYFLMTWDYCKHSREALGCRTPPGRGSAAGCFVSYLLDITNVDSVKYGLSFERFYNAGRNVPGKPAALPDIDTDFPPEKRESVIEYLQNKWGKNNVAAIATFGRLQGRESLKAVLRAHSWGTHDDHQRITELIPQEASITDDLQEMKEEDGEASIIQWAIENESGLAQWVEYKDGELRGPLAHHFAQAIRLEGTKRSMGRHPSGIVVCPTPIGDECPIVYDKKTGMSTIAFDMNGAEYMGMVKADILGLNTLSRIDICLRLMRTGEIS